MRSQSTIVSLLREGAETLAEISPTPRLDAEVLLGHLLGLSRLHLIVEGSTPVAAECEATFRALLARRGRHEPVAYLTGTKEFWGLDFAVTPAVLIPRPDTEVLVEESIRLLSKSPRVASLEEPFRVLDLGTGSGCIAIAISHEARQRGIPVSVIATDKSERALAVACHNAEHLGVPVQFIRAEWVEPFSTAAVFDLIISNPPYIDPTDTNRSPETDHEPSSALFASDSGLSDIRHLLATCPSLLRTGGGILLEVGVHQAQVVVRDHLPTGFVGHTVQDLSGIERVVVVRSA